MTTDVCFSAVDCRLDVRVIVAWDEVVARGDVVVVRTTPGRREQQLFLPVVEKT